MSQCIRLEPLKIFLPSLERLIFREESVDKTRLIEEGLHLLQLLPKLLRKSLNFPNRIKSRLPSLRYLFARRGFCPALKRIPSE